MSGGKDDKRREREKRRLIKDFRYGIIAELVNPYLKNQEFVELLNAKAAREYEIPYSKKTTITAAAIRLWIKNYTEHGENGLLPRESIDFLVGTGSSHLVVLYCTKGVPCSDKG